MTTTNLGKVSVTPKGEYDPLITYERLDIVSHNGSSYIVKQTSIGVTPIEGEFYALIAEKGDGGSFLEKSYKTYAAMELDKPNLTANISTRVSNDPDTTKNGSYTYDGAVFTRSQYDSKVVTDKIIADAASAVQDAINNTAVEGGVLADTFVVVDGTVNQRTINRGLESIAELATIANPKDGLRVYVKSYHAGLRTGGGHFTYNSSLSSENDGGSVINGWVRDYIPDSMPIELWGAKGDGVSNDSVAFRGALGYARESGGTVIGRSKLGYFVSNNFNVYSSIDIDRIKFPTDASGMAGTTLLINSEHERVEIPREGIAGLVEGSYKVNGLPQNSEGKYFMITSREVLAPRELHPQSRTAYKGANGNWWFTGDTSSGIVEVDTGLVITDKEARNGAWLRKGTTEENKLYIGDRPTSIPYLDSSGREIYSLPFEAPYFKNTVFKNIGDGLISPSLDMSFYDDEDYTIYQMPVDDPIEIKIGYIDIVGTPSLTSRRAIINRRSNVTFKINKVNELARFTMLLSSEEGNNLTIDGGTYGGTRKDTIGYMVSIAYGCDINIIGVKGTGNGRTSFDGRHVSNLYFENCSGIFLGSHWANNIRITHSTLKRTGGSGRDLFIDNSVIHEGVMQKTDSIYYSGTLSITNCTYINSYGTGANNVLFFARTTIDKDYWGSPRKFFDYIKIDNLDMHFPKGGSTSFALLNLGYSTNCKIQVPEHVKLSNINVYSEGTLTRLRLFEYTDFGTNSTYKGTNSLLEFENIRCFTNGKETSLLEIQNLMKWGGDTSVLPITIKLKQCNVNTMYTDFLGRLDSCQFLECTIGTFNSSTGGQIPMTKPIIITSCTIKDANFIYTGEISVSHSHFVSVTEHISRKPTWLVAYNTYEPSASVPTALEAAEGTVKRLKKYT